MAVNSTLNRDIEIKIPGPDHPITISPAEGSNQNKTVLREAKGFI
jgi:hypothetical protein